MNLKVLIAHSDNTTETEIDKAKNLFTNKFNISKDKDLFVNVNPNIIFLISNNSEQHALKHIEAHKRYCILASETYSSWESAIELKAVLTAKGIKTKIFDFNKLKDLQELKDFLEYKKIDKPIKVGIIGKISSNLIASTPDFELLKELLNIEIVNIEANSIVNTLNKFNITDDINQNNTNIYELGKQLEDIQKLYSVEAISIDNRVINEVEYSYLVLALEQQKTCSLTLFYTTDLCLISGLISFYKLSSKLSQAATIYNITRENVYFKCIKPNVLKSQINSINDNNNDKTVTIFRIDHKFEYCSLALGEIVDINDDIYRIKLSLKGLFLLREFPLGNNHIIIHGDYTDMIAEFFTEEGFRIV